VRAGGVYEPACNGTPASQAAPWARPVRRQLTALVAAAWLALGTVLAAMPAAVDPGAMPAGSGSHDDLVALFEEFRGWRLPQQRLKTGDYSKVTIGNRIKDVERFQKRADDMNVAAWDRHQRVDWLAVRAQMDQEEFLLKVSRPWARDPGYYVDPLLRVGFTELPLAGEALEAFRQELRDVETSLANARENLTDVAADYADFALHNLANSDGVNLRHPWRAVPPDGVIGWFDDLLSRVRELQPALEPEVAATRAVIVEFQAWLQAQRPGMTAEAGVGEELLDWYLQHVKYMPYRSADVVVLAERELQRTYTFWLLERRRNRNIPELELPATREAYYERMALMDKEVREWLVEDGFITIPDYIPTDWEEFGFNALWLERAGGPNFWEQVLYRDPNPDHWHAVIPGHRFDGALNQRIEHPIRRHMRDSGRAEGWALYLEETPLQLGFYDQYQRPRGKELIYVFGIFRAVRTAADVRMQRNEMDAKEAASYWIKWTPYLDEDVARVDAEIYLRRPPGYGLSYTIGSFELSKLLMDRQHQLGADFSLKDFHDYLMQAGWLPVSLLRYDLTGYDDEVSRFWQRTPLEKMLKRRR